MIFIAGATGFVGGHLVEHLRSKGLGMKCLVRSEAKAKSLAAQGIEVVRGDVTDGSSIRGVLGPDDLVVHLVGIIEEKKGATFQGVHVEGTANLVAEAKRAGVRHFFYQSALGADGGSWSGYLRTKAEAEEIVLSSGLEYTIFRPSLIIGPWDGFTRKMLDMLRLSPVIPIPGEGKAKFQPIYIMDWLRCIDKVIEDPKSYCSRFELGGPEQLSYREIVGMLAEAAGLKKPVFNVPMGLMRLSAAFLGAVLSSPPVTSDQLRLLESDNVCAPDAVERNFGFRPTTLREALKEFINKS
ncbi:MAG: complex I NDUFA9 subunit family protein [Nitrospiraceae bacterium]|nr:complex I NDUFA9 subunit family protein [Nitrospiraceae bacterium]